MKKTVITGMFFLVFILSISLNAQWIKTYGGAYSDFANSIQQTMDGGYIVAGGSDEGPCAWVLKLSSLGDIEWKKSSRDSPGNRHIANSIQQTMDGGYIVAGGRGIDAWIFKLYPNGKVEWQKSFGDQEGNVDIANSIKQTMDGGYIVAGGKGLDDAWVLKFSSLGDIEWQKSYGDKAGNRHIANSIQQTMDGGYIVAGERTFKDGIDAWVFKLYPNGKVEWQKSYGGSYTDTANSIQQTMDGGYIVGGTYNGLYSDAWILKLSSLGDVEWQKSCGDQAAFRHNAHSIQQTNDGGYIVAGTMDSRESDYDIWIFKLSQKGDFEWQKTYGAGFKEGASCIQQTMDGGYIVAGTTESFGAGSSDILILKLLPNGEINHCKFVNNSNGEIINTDVGPDDQKIKIRNTDVTLKKTNISTRNIKLKVFSLCSGRPLLTILTTDGGTTDPEPGTYIYDLGTEVTVTATVDSEYEFYGWEGDASGSSNPITITMDSDKSIKADFHEPIDWGGGGGGGGGDDGGCFIATTAYGSFLHPHVKILREFRDKYLVPHKLGRSIVDFYYKYSPSVARFIAKHKALKIPVRISLLPLVSLSYSLLLFGPVITAALILFLALLPILFIKISRRRRRIAEE
jgi:hypothetical protein